MSPVDGTVMAEHRHWWATTVKPEDAIKVMTWSLDVSSMAAAGRKIQLPAPPPGQDGFLSAHCGVLAYPLLHHGAPLPGSAESDRRRVLNLQFKSASERDRVFDGHLGPTGSCRMSLHSPRRGRCRDRRASSISVRASASKAILNGNFRPANRGKCCASATRTRQSILTDAAGAPLRTAC